MLEIMEGEVTSYNPDCRTLFIRKDGEPYAPSETFYHITGIYIELNSSDLVGARATLRVTKPERNGRYLFCEVVSGLIRRETEVVWSKKR